MDRWYRLALRAEWAKFAEMKADFGTVDRASDFFIFNIDESKYRLVASIDFDDQVLLQRFTLG